MSPPVKILQVPLNQTTYDQIAGWVAYYQANPSLVGKIPTGASPPDGQTKIVFDDQSAEFFHAIESQFAAPAPISVPTGPVQPFLANALDTPTRKQMAAMPEGVVFYLPGSGRRKCSWAIDSGGYPCFLSFSPHFPADATVNATGGTPWLDSPDGDWNVYLFYTADPGRVQLATLDIYPA